MKRSPPNSLLSRIVIESPCHESWEGMTGDDRQRHCGRCRKNVYNLSELTEREALTLIGAGKPLCLRLYRRPDGSVLTKECGVGIRKRWQTRAMLSAAVVALLVAVGLKRASAEPKELPPGEFLAGGITVQQQPELGDIAYPLPTPTAEPTPIEAQEEESGSDDEN